MREHESGRCGVVAQRLCDREEGAMAEVGKRRREVSALRRMRERGMTKPTNLHLTTIFETFIVIESFLSAARLPSRLPLLLL